MILTLDLETSIHNKGNAFDTRNFIVSAHIKRNTSQTQCTFYDEPDFISTIRDALSSASICIGVNLKFDLLHLRNKVLGVPVGCRVWDCMLAEFILSGQTNSFVGLDALAARYGLGKKDTTVADYWEKGVSTENIPRDIVATYGNHDVDLSCNVYQAQLKDERMSPELHKLILLAGCDLLVLADMEFNGFKYNVEGSIEHATTLQEELKGIDDELLQASPHPINLDSGDQLSCFLYGGSYTEAIFTSEPATYLSGAKKGQDYIRNRFSHTNTIVFPQLFVPLKGSALKKEGFYSTAEDVLLQLKAKTKQQKRVITLLCRRSVVHKLITTYLLAMPELIETMHWADNTIHGQFNQVVARTGRLSSSRPNMQNAPEEVDEFFVSRFAS